MTALRRVTGQFRRPGVVLLAAIVIAMPTASAPAAPSASAAAPVARTRTFVDPENDQTGRAPDITSVVLSSDPRGKVVFTIAIRNYNTLAPRVSSSPSSTPTAIGGPV